ncbi:VOC family protein [Paludibaculum fermentans]|uniref:VOC family protein n=1 Tax=Paludibaculum fermentans TaxID=1473598 RepID=UPI003EBDDBCF
MARPVHFEIPADNTERAIAFYETLFGWKFSLWPGPMPYWLITTGPAEERGIDGGMIQRAHPGQGVVNTVDVKDIDASVATALANGAEMAVPKMAIPGVGWLVYCKDPEGNMFGMMQADQAAA